MDARENTRFEPDYVVAPGETLLEVLEEKGMTQVELARRTGLTAKHVNQIVKGQATITAETATKLEGATAVPARVWLGLQATFDEGTSRLNESAQLAAEVGWLTDFPVRELVKRGYLRRCDHAVDQLRELLNFFGVATRQAFSVLWNQQVAFRQSAVFDSDQGSVAAWLRMGELDAAQIECAPFDRKAFSDALSKARSLTLVRDFAFFAELQRLCAAAGVAVVIVPETPKARVFGAARWLTPEKALIQLSFRQKSNDVFWFSFFHEARHVLQETKRNTFLEGKDTKTDELERDADQFASDFLIPPQFKRRLHEIETLAEATQLASELGIAPGIVVGRLHHLELKPYSWGAKLKWRYEFHDA